MYITTHLDRFGDCYLLYLKNNKFLISKILYKIYISFLKTFCVDFICGSIPLIEKWVSWISWEISSINFIFAWHDLNFANTNFDVHSFRLVSKNKFHRCFYCEVNSFFPYTYYKEIHEKLLLSLLYFVFSRLVYNKVGLTLLRLNDKPDLILK